MDEQHTIDSSEYAEYLRYKQNQKYKLFAVQHEPTSNDGPRTQARPSFDVGSCWTTKNVIDEPTYHSIHKMPALQKFNTEYYGYTAGTALPVLGQFIADVSTFKTTTKAGFIVVKGRAELLLGYRTAVS
ncbi:hypothetical protein BpHYR1_026337, partial [Brachionus plicatilis]